jgi:hypothetical protein
MDFDIDRATFSASVMLLSIVILALVFKWFLWILLILFLGLSVWKGYVLFVQKKVRYDGFDVLKNPKKRKS